jgi:uncharacterized protein
MPEFEWDSRKNKANIAKHGIDFALAKRIFDGPILSLPDTRQEYGEERTISIGMVDDIAVLVVVHTDRNRKIRIISARAASRRERKMYHDKIQKISNT